MGNIIGFQNDDLCICETFSTTHAYLTTWIYFTYFTWQCSYSRQEMQDIKLLFPSYSFQDSGEQNRSPDL